MSLLQIAKKRLPTEKIGGQINEGKEGKKSFDI